MNPRPSTLRTALDEAAKTLAVVSTTPRIDAEALAMHVCRLERRHLITQADKPLTDEEHTAFQKLVERRQRGEPVAYLVGTREFWSLALNVTPAVLIPRPETELLVERALARIPRSAGYAIADLGTGSGAVAIAIAHERPRCRVIAVDASPAALDIARMNAERLKLVNIDFHHGDWYTPLMDMRFNIIVSNPPYVRSDDPHLQQGDARFEPKTALISGTDGLDSLRRIVAGASAHLRPGGWLLLEHGYDQAESVRNLLATARFSEIASQRDLAGHERVTEAIIPC